MENTSLLRFFVSQPVTHRKGVCPRPETSGDRRRLVSEFVADERVFRHVDAAGDDRPVRVGRADHLGDSYCHRVVDGRLPELICDASAVPAAMELPIMAACPWAPT